MATMSVNDKNKKSIFESDSMKPNLCHSPRYRVFKNLQISEIELRQYSGYSYFTLNI